MNRNLIYSLVFLLLSVSFFSCSKEYSSETGAFTTAKGTLHDNSGNCYPSTVIGNYYTGVTLNDSNYLELQVNVTTAGNYNIVTDTVNGFFFKDAGIFSSTGVKTIQLKSSGKPVFNQNTDFLVIFDSTICTFTVSVEDSTGSSGGGSTTGSAWQFTEGTKSFQGSIDTAFTFDTTVQGQSFKILQIQGSTAGDSVLLLGFTVLGGVITPGAYTTNTFALFRFLGSYNDNDTLYSANPLIPTVNTTITVTSYNATTRIIQGTFLGTAKDKNKNNVTISSGKFEAKLD